LNEPLIYNLYFIIGLYCTSLKEKYESYPLFYILYSF